MTVYKAMFTEDAYESEEIFVGIFSSKDKAKNAIEEALNKYIIENELDEEDKKDYLLFIKGVEVDVNYGI